MKVGFFPGSFDPPTLAHVTLLGRCANLVDSLVVGVGTHHHKVPLLTADQRCRLLDSAVRTMVAQENISCQISVRTFDGLAVHAAQQSSATVLFRGVRDTTDFDYEIRMMEINRQLAPTMDTLLVPARAEERGISATVVKQIASMHGSLKGFLSAEVEEEVRKAIRDRTLSSGP